MSTIIDGGPAFPHDNQELGDKHRIAQPGMSLRDWFAAHATEQDIEHHRELSLDDESQPYWKRSRAAARYAHADAMIAERAKGGAS